MRKIEKLRIVFDNEDVIDINFDSEGNIKTKKFSNGVKVIILERS